MVERDRGDRGRRPGGAMTLVASSRPPSPVSSNTISAGMRAKARNAAAVVISKKVIGAPRLARSHSSSSSTSRVFVDQLAGEADALVKAHQMRRDVGVDPVAGGFEAGAQGRDRRALAVGAGDMDDRRQLVLRIAERRQQPLDAAERQVDQLRVQRAQPRQDRRRWSARLMPASGVGGAAAPAGASARAAGRAMPPDRRRAARRAARPCRPCRARADIRRAETPPAISRGSSPR